MASRKFLGALSLGVVFVLLAGCEEFDTGRTSSDDNAVDGVQYEQNPDSIWTFDEATDPFTDDRSSTMTSRFLGDFAVVDVVVKCGGSGSLSYRFTTFDADGTPLPMSRLPSAMEVQLGSNLIKTISYRIRVDDLEADTGRVIDPRHDNSFVIGPEPLLGGPTSNEMKSGEVLTVGLTFDRGKDTIFVDQTDSGLRTWLNDCGGGRKPTSELSGVSNQGQTHQNDREVVPPSDRGADVDGTEFETCMARVSRVESGVCLSAEIDRLSVGIDPETYDLIRERCKDRTENELNASIAELECILGELPV